MLSCRNPTPPPRLMIAQPLRLIPCLHHPTHIRYLTHHRETQHHCPHRLPPLRLGHIHPSLLSHPPSGHRSLARYVSGMIIVCAMRLRSVLSR
jgi:hypothetical protein